MSISPTLLALNGLPEDPKNEGADISPLLANPDIDWDMPAITANGEGNHAVRWKNWSYILHRGGDEELYDLGVDPHEWDNLAMNMGTAWLRWKMRRMIPKPRPAPL